jgi:cell division transport system permease protein
VTFLQALAYFVREAGVSLVRSWRVSLLATFTIAVSLFVGGSFLVVGAGLESLVERWRSETKVILYLRPALPGAELQRLRRAAAAPWVRTAGLVTPQAASERFRDTFPSLADLLEGWGEEPLPASLELAFDPAAAADPAFDRWIERLRADPAVAMLDDDRDWLAQLALLVRVVRGAGFGLGAVLLAAAMFTIASVVRLTAHLYREEIAIMRLVGATEFFIRGPFYVEGLLQGALGGTLAAVALAAAHRVFLARAGLHPELAAAARFLGPLEVLLLVGLGAAAGLAGAIASLRREPLDVVPSD